MKQISVTEFKAKCLALLKEVERTGEAMEVLNRGRPVARVIGARLMTLDERIIESGVVPVV